MKNWFILKYVNPDPKKLVVCGECSHLWPVRDLIEILRPKYEHNCSECGKSCGDYFKHFEKEMIA